MIVTKGSTQPIPSSESHRNFFQGFLHFHKKREIFKVYVELKALL